MISSRNTEQMLVWSFLAIPFFALLYLEDRMFIFGLSLSNIWKLSILAFAGILYVYRFMFTPTIWQFSIFLVCLTYPLGVGSGLSEITLDVLPVFLALPLFFAVFYSKLFATYRSVEIFLVGLSIFFIVSGIPFAIGILEEPVSVVESSLAYTERYGVSHDTLIGFFKHPSIAGKIFAFCSAFLAFVVVARPWHAKMPRAFIALIALIGFYFTYLSFVRTAWLMLMVMLFFGVAGLSYRLEKKQFILVLCFGLLVLLLASNQPGFMNRLLNLKLDSPTDASIITYSSGRVLIWMKIYFAMMSEGPLSFLIGLGGEGYDQAIGYVYAHSMIVQVFAFSGLIGLILLASFFWYYHKWLQMHAINSSESRFLRSMIWSFGIAALLSHGIEFYGAVIFAGISAMLSRRRNEFSRITS